jgi:EAL domain-containing protein (putative c-di-GMP-specific phosphodiesterase class I)
VVNLGHGFNMKVTAEGVETEEQLAILRDIGCDEIQGYIHSRPLPADEFSSFLGNQ